MAVPVLGQVWQLASSLRRTQPPQCSVLSATPLFDAFRRSAASELSLLSTRHAPVIGHLGPQLPRCSALSGNQPPRRSALSSCSAALAFSDSGAAQAGISLANEMKRCRAKQTASALAGISLVTEMKRCHARQRASALTGISICQHFPRERDEALSAV